MVEIRPATWNDLEGVHAVLAARSRAVFGTTDEQLSHLRSRWELPSFRVGRDNWVAAANGNVLGYAALDATKHVTHAAPDATVGDALLELVVARAREQRFDHIVTTAVPEDVPLSELVERHGFEVDREILRMWKHLDGGEPEPAWPDGVTVRAYIADDGEHVHRALDDAYAAWDDDYVARGHADWLEFMTNHDEFDPDVWFLAERDGDLVGAALHWKEQRGDGWVKDIVVREQERGRGLGRALLLHGFHEYRRRGASRVGLKVDSTNPTGARALYERVGFVVDRRYAIWMKRL